MSIPITSATSGSSTNRCTTRAPHHRATPVTRTRLFLAIALSLLVLLRCGARPEVARSPRDPTLGPGAPSPTFGSHLFSCFRPVLIRSLDHVAFHEDDGARHHVQERGLGLAEGELELAQQ